MVKVWGGLSSPFPVRRGIRQGCLLSVLLYSLALEPLLCRLRTKLIGVSLPGLLQESPLALSAYADDINVFIQNQVV